MRRFALFFVVLAVCSVRVEAQSDSLLTRVLTDTTSLLGRLSVDSTRVVPQQIQVRTIRFASATGGFMFGIVLGGFAGHEIESEDCSSNCRRRMGDALLTGAAIGGGLGAALGSAFLN